MAIITNQPICIRCNGEKSVTHMSQDMPCPECRLEEYIEMLRRIIHDFVEQKGSVGVSTASDMN